MVSRMTWRIKERGSMRIIVMGLTLVGCLLAASHLRAQPSSAQTPPALEAELGVWVNALGAREFDSRDRAMQSLISAGRTAIDPVLQVTSRGDHEVATRAVMVLKGIGERGDISTLEAVLVALNRVAEMSTLPVGKRAIEVRERLQSVRQDRAIEFFQSRGAEVHPEYEDNWTSTFTAEPIFSIELGSGWKGTEKDLERLQWLRDVKQVCMIGPKVQDDWIRHLRGMPGLEYVKLKHANVTEKAIEELTHLERLRALRLQFIPVGDEMVPYLEKCDGLIRLIVISRTLTDAGKKRLKDRFHDNVECMGGALLGVKAGLEEPWSIREVVPGSAAEKAGLQTNDRIVAYNGQPIASFPELKALISKSFPGDTAMVDVERGTEILKMKIVFGEWD